MSVFAETTAEVGTIAGIVSAVAMALVGAISSYISYQKKKLCFGVQRKSLEESVPHQCVTTAASTAQTILFGSLSVGVAAVFTF